MSAEEQKMTELILGLHADQHKEDEALELEWIKKVVAVHSL